MTNHMETTGLFKEISQLIELAKNHVASYANSALVMMYWEIGYRINKEVLNNERAEYGEQIIAQLSKQLTDQYGSGFNRPNLSRMSRFARFYQDKKICVTLSHKLSWSHFVKLISVEDSLKRDFYTEMARLEGWSVRVLREKIDSMLFERTAIAKYPEKLIKIEMDKLKNGDAKNPDLYLQDPCVLEFLYNKPIHSERDLEDAILSEMQAFIQNMSSDFCFLARQKRMSTEKNDRFLDLLFFNRRLRRLIAIELKFGPFQPEHAGQMEWYLKWLEKYEKMEDEEKPLGIIICSDKDQEDIELLELGKNGIHVAQYMAQLPPRQIFQSKLHQAIKNAREKYERLQILSTSDDNHEKE